MAVSNDQPSGSRQLDEHEDAAASDLAAAGKSRRVHEDWNHVGEILRAVRDSKLDVVVLRSRHLKVAVRRARRSYGAGLAGKAVARRVAILSPSVGRVLARGDVAIPTVGTAVEEGGIVADLDVAGNRVPIEVPARGTLVEIAVQAGDAVEYGQLIALISIADSE